ICRSILVYLIIFFFFVFFFQAEDGIRDRNVTGVQTCALPISLDSNANNYILLTPTATIINSIGPGIGALATGARVGQTNLGTARSEERRVGKECRSRWSRED